MNWTTPSDLRAQIQRLWDKGTLPASLVSQEPLFPRRLPLRRPTSAELSDRFEQVRLWIADLQKGQHYRVVMRKIQHQIIGTNAVPDEIWIDTLDDALALIGREKDAMKISRIAALTRARCPFILPWVTRYPLKALKLDKEWPLFLDIIAWMQAHPNPGVYPRQMDVPGIHTKFVETHSTILTELLDLGLPPGAVDNRAASAGRFCRRYGLLEKPLRIRFRILDPKLSLLPAGTDQDITINQEAFNRLDLAVNRVFITENEINFLSFPSAPESLVIFGGGYGFEMLAKAVWLRRCSIHYWGDIDTHGFAILDQLRSHLPHARSFLMDRETLMEHEPQWVIEPRPIRRDLARLSPEEEKLFEDLRDGRIRPVLRASIRLEQERIGFSWIKTALKSID